MEVQSRILKKTEEEGFIREFWAGVKAPAGLSVSHLFADYTILFCDASREQLLYIRMVLICFEAITGLKINVDKTEIVPVEEVGSLDALTEILCYKVESLPMTYLGMPLAAHYKAKSVLNPILEKMEWKLAGWKRL